MNKRPQIKIFNHRVGDAAVTPAQKAKAAMIGRALVGDVLEMLAERLDQIPGVDPGDREVF